MHPSSLASPEKEGRLLEGCDINTESERMNRSKLGKGGGERLPDKGNKQPVQSLEATKNMSLKKAEIKPEETRNPHKISKFLNVGNFLINVNF